jgi:uncharacterized BrkB/YihY/UPF0761 family membrane protein
MEVFEKIEALYKKAEEISNSQNDAIRQLNNNIQSLNKAELNIKLTLSSGVENLNTSVNKIPKHVHVTEEYGLNKHTKILGWAVLVTIILTASMVIWLMPKAELEYIQYQQNKISEQEEKLDYFISKNPKTLKSWNELHSQ